VLLSAAQERVSRLGFDPTRCARESVDRCNLCGSSERARIADSDRYGFHSPAWACTSCGLVFLDPRLTAEEYRSFYREIYRPLVSAFHGRRIDEVTVEEEQHPYANALVQLLEPFVPTGGDGVLLDVGGSTGVVAEAVARRFGLTGLVLDPAPAEASRAATRGLEVVVGTAETYDPGERRFALVLLCQTIDHLLDPAAVLAGLRRLLAPGGALFVDIVDFRSAYLRRQNVEAALKIDHPFAFTQPTAEAMLARAGLVPTAKDFAADELHVGYVCRAGNADPSALPPAEEIEQVRREMRDLARAEPAP
jgi:SAM-dependent methyltransferase